MIAVLNGGCLSTISLMNSKFLHSKYFQMGLTQRELKKIRRWKILIVGCCEVCTTTTRKAHNVDIFLQNVPQLIIQILYFLENESELSNISFLAKLAFTTSTISILTSTFFLLSDCYVRTATRLCMHMCFQVCEVIESFRSFCCGSTSCSRRIPYEESNSKHKKIQRRPVYA